MPTGLGDEQLWLCPSLDNATPFNDLSSQGNNGTAQGGLSTVADTGSGGAYAYDLDGSNDYIDVTSSGVPASAYTVSLWQYSTNSGTSVAFNAGETSGNRTVNIDGVRAGQNGDSHGHRRGATPYWVVNPIVRTSATWYHYLLTYDGSELRLYVDGVYVANLTGVPNTDRIEDRCWIGQYVGGSYFFQGRIDDIRTYGRVLTQSERGHLATARGIEGRPFDGLGDEQLWLCPSLENSPNDLSGNNNNGVYQNGMGTIADVAEGGSLAYDLAVNEDRIEISGIGSNWRASGAWTISMWIKGMASQANQQLVANGNVNLYRNSTSGEKIQTQQLSPYRATGYTATGVATSVWYHLTCTSDGTNLKMFANGVEFRSAVGGLATSNTGTMSFGSTAAQSPNGSPIVRLDDIRAYNRALTQSEISWLATERGVLGTPPEGLGDEQLWLCPSIQDSANDLSGNGNNGTYNGGMGTVADTSNGGSLAYDFDGVDDYLDCGDILDSQVWTAGDFAISGWIKSDGLNTVQVFNKYYQPSGNRQFQFRIIHSGGNLRLNAYIHTTLNNSEYRYWLGSTNLSADTWYHVVLNYDASASSDDRASCFIDGSSEAMTVTDAAGTLATISDGSASLAAGARVEGGSATDFRSGSSDDLRVYNRVLSQAEITHLATSRGVLGSPATTTQYNAFLTHAFRQLFQTRLR